MTCDLVHYFGYGSLVNRATRPVGEHCVNAVLSGWHRVWNHRFEKTGSFRTGCTSLSIEPWPGHIAGVIVPLPAALLAELDVRESGYDRLALPARDFFIEGDLMLAPDDTVFVYRSHETNRYDPQPGYPVLQTYVDCVMAGYLQRFGDPGLQSFLESTHGWEGKRYNDRAFPDYPRAVDLPVERLAHFDAILAAVPAAEDLSMLSSVAS